MAEGANQRDLSACRLSLLLYVPPPYIQLGRGLAVADRYRLVPTAYLLYVLGLQVVRRLSTRTVAGSTGGSHHSWGWARWLLKRREVALFSQPLPGPFANACLLLGLVAVGKMGSKALDGVR